MNNLKAEILNHPVSEPVLPWRKVGQWGINGTRALGYSNCSCFILVTTSDGRGLFDCRSGDKVLRDRDAYEDKELQLICDGIGEIEGEEVRMSGLHGGGLINYTADEWRIEIVSPDWPKIEILLVEPGSSLHGSKYDRRSNFQRIWTGYQVRGAGFSIDGETLCIADSSDLVIYNRHSN